MTVRRRVEWLLALGMTVSACGAALGLAFLVACCLVRGCCS